MAVLRGLRLERALSRLPLAVLLLILAGCAPPDAEATVDPEADIRELLGVSASVGIHRITLGGRADVDHVQPPLVEARDGDLVYFHSIDHRAKWIRFSIDSIPEASRRFLLDTGQSASPPLVDPDTRFVISFEGAPEGDYPFLVQGHGAPVPGLIRVAPPSS